MTLQKSDIELLNKISKGGIKGFHSGEVDIAMYEKILTHSAQWLVDSKTSEQDSFDEVLSRIELKERPQNGSVPFKFLKIAAAISAVLLSVIVLYNWINERTFEAKLAEIKTIYLPDSSKVVLNAGSQISFSASDWKKGNRKVKLTGQAYFEVIKGSKFSVISNEGVVNVLGTSFNIYDREGTYRVECFTGKVSVESSKNREKVYLTKGLRTELNVNSAEKLDAPIKFNQERSIEWISGVFNFHNTPLVEVFAELERQYNIEVRYANISGKYYTGTFDKEDLKKSIINICKPMGYKYEFKENNILFISN